MPRLSWLLASTAVVGAMGIAPAAAQNRAAGPPEAVTQAATTTSGRIQGTVTDTVGAPLGGAMVSALGPTTAFTVTDANGWFELKSLPPGPYLIRAHLSGYAASRREIVDVTASGRARYSFALRRVGGEDAAGDGEPPVPARPVLVAGILPAAGQPDAAADRADASASTTEPHDHSATAWRLRHARRSVLKDTTSRIATEAAASDAPFLPGTMALLGRAMESSARFAATFFDEFPFSGQINLLTTSAFDGPADLFATDGLPRGTAYLAIGAPAGRHGEWSVQGAMTQGDVSSWILAGSYATHVPATHAFDVGMSYSTQRYEGGNPAALAAVSADTRNVGAVHAFDHWIISRLVAVTYGGRYAWHDYLNGSGLFSPRVGVTLSPIDRTRIRAVASQRLLAPGAEEFLPPASAGLWLPPERTFAPLAAGADFRAARTRHVELALEREFADAYVLGVRRFYQGVSDQPVTLFGVRAADGSRSDLGHYFVASAGSVVADGWGVTLTRSLARRFRGSIDYSLTRARWHASPGAARVAEWAPSAVRARAEGFHDVTTAVETEIPETATSVFVVYRVNSAYARAALDAGEPGVDARFDVQVKQALPFLPFASHWEVLVGVRSLFREAHDGASVYDELLVVRPPKRIVGGLVVKF